MHCYRIINSGTLPAAAACQASSGFGGALAPAPAQRDPTVLPQQWGNNLQGNESFLTQPGPAVGGVPGCPPIYSANYKCNIIVMNIVTELFSYFVLPHPHPQVKFSVPRSSETELKDTFL